MPETIEIRKTYKSNIYEIAFTGNMIELTNALNGYELIEQTQDGELCKAKVKIPDKSSPNELLQRILLKVQIQSFNEVLPSMRDVFIQVVKGERRNT